MIAAKLELKPVGSPELKTTPPTSDFTASARKYGSGEVRTPLFPDVSSGRFRQEVTPLDVTRVRNRAFVPTQAIKPLAMSSELREDAMTGFVP